MESLSVHLYKESFGPFLKLLNDNDVTYQMREQRSGVPMAASMAMEIIKSAAMWGGLATVIVAFIKARHGRKVMLTTKDNRVIHAEGLTKEELEKILEQTKSLTAIETDPERT